MLNSFHHRQPFVLESGVSLPGLHIAYHTYGTLNEDKSNVVWICHALTANADAVDWWKGLVGEGCVLNPEEYFIVCANILGSCYGTTGPASINVDTGKPFYNDFPAITIRDITNAHILLKQHLNIDSIKILVGGSMGGYQALEWALMQKESIERLFLLVTSAAESAWGIAIHTAQRMAIEADGTFGNATADAGAMGLKAARAIGMLTYRNYALMNLQQTDADNTKTDDFKASTYLYYQGDKLVNRFNAYSYYRLTKAMDTHNISRGRVADTTTVLLSIRQPVLLIGISSDILCPPQEQQYLAAHLPDCRYEEIDSQYGHDGFLIETEKIGLLLSDWMAETPGSILK